MQGFHYICGWCGASFDNESILQEHELIHRNLDFLNGKQQSPAPKKRKVVITPEYYFSDEYLKDLLNFNPDNCISNDEETPHIPSAEDTSTDNPKSSSLTVSSHRNDNFSPVPGPSHRRDDCLTTITGQNRKKVRLLNVLLLVTKVVRGIHVLNPFLSLLMKVVI